MIKGIAAPAPAGATFFDCDSPLSGRQAATFRAAGFTGAARYLSRGPGQSAGDLSPIEAQTLLTAGLAIVPVQHVPRAGWTPTATLGRQYGINAASNAASTGCPAGVCVWLDLESVSPDAEAAEVIAYCEAWFAEVRRGLFVPGLYVGVSPGLDASALFHALSVQHYWHAGSRAAPIPIIRGVQIVQRIANQQLAGVGYDTNTVQADALGGLPIWWAPK